MKKIIISVIILFIVMNSFGQIQKDSDSFAYLAFKGVPINGTLKEYVLKMKESGLSN